MDRVVLISTYELGRQPFGLASPAAWLKEAGADVVLQDLAVDDIDDSTICGALLVGVYVPMHTATRMAESLLRRITEVDADAHVVVYGLYATMNADHLRRLGADAVIGGEFEEPLVALYRELREARTCATGPPVDATVLSLGRQQFLVPDRRGLPALNRYAALELTSSTTRTVGYTEASRGCKHLCRHCPIVPVYGGRFRVVQVPTVLADVRQQVLAGAEHITFGDPDFLNAPAHAMRIVAALHDEFPGVTYDATIKVEHLIRHADLVGELKRTGCVLVTSAVESFDDAELQRLDKRHTLAEFERALALLRDTGLALNPTFVAFAPWTTAEGYLYFLETIRRLPLVDEVAPVQYSIRMLIPAGSRLLELADVAALVDDFDPTALAYPWSNPDPRLDAVHREVVEIVQDGSAARSRRETFTAVWRAATNLLGRGNDDPDLGELREVRTIPQLTEPWYCCAEPTDSQLLHL
jgi:radical SAM superfamily enzyme YgiQ (UPF0313 family)